MSTSKTDAAKNGLAQTAKAIRHITIALIAFFVIGIGGTLLLDPGTQAHTTFSALLLFGTAIYLSL